MLDEGSGGNGVRCSDRVGGSGGRRRSVAGACKPGVISYGGAKAIVYCGPAKATAKTTNVEGPLTLGFANGGRCEIRQRYVRIDIGTRMLSAPNKTKPDYFQLVIGATPGANELPVTKDGTYGRALITVIRGGAEYLPDGTRGTVTLKKKRPRSGRPRRRAARARSYGRSSPADAALSNRLPLGSQLDAA